MIAVHLFIDQNKSTHNIYDSNHLFTDQNKSTHNISLLDIHYFTDVFNIAQLTCMTLCSYKVEVNLNDQCIHDY